MDEEMRFHLDSLTEHFEKAGVSPIDARRLAAIEFGGVERQRDAAFDVLRPRVVEDLARDLRFAARLLVRTPVMTLATILTLGVGMGATTALFGLVDHLVLRTVAAPNPEELYAIVRDGPGDASESMPYPLYRTLSRVPALGQTAGYAFRVSSVGLGDDSAVVQLTTPNWFSTLGVRPVAGRAWDTSDVETQDAVISDAFWARRFGRSPSVIGTALSLDGHSFKVSGVMKPGFTGVSLDFPADVWVPISAQPQFDGASSMDDRNLNWVRVIVRIGDSTSVARVSTAANLVAAQMRSAGLAVLDSTEHLALANAAAPIARDRSHIERTLYLALALAGLVLLIACANVANLQFARSAARRREIAVRLAIGAGRARLVRQLLAESLMLALLGGAVGLWVAFVLGRVVTGFAASAGLGLAVGLLVGQVVNLHTLVFTATLSLAAAVGFGLMPAVRSSRVNVIPELRQKGFSVVRRAGRGGANALLVAQITLSLVLLVSALVVASELRAALSVDLGFQPAGLLQVSSDWRGVSDAIARADAANIAEALETMPGVVAASVSAPAGFGRATAATDVLIENSAPAQSKPTTVEYQVVSPEFLSTMGTSIVRGRPFADHDRAGAELVTIVNEAAARQLFPGREAVGERFNLFGAARRVRVVGVAHDVRLHSATAPPPAVVYVPLAQDAGAAVTNLLTVELRIGKGAPSPKQIEQRIAAVDSHIKSNVRAVSGLIGESLAVDRLTAWATGAFGLFGMLLAMVGVYGLHSYIVSQRTTELGIRLAMGATPSRVLWEVWRRAMRPVVVGSALGLAAAAISEVWLKGAFTLSLADVKIAALATAILASIAAAACFVPAWAAAALDPARALRAD